MPALTLIANPNELLLALSPHYAVRARETWRIVLAVRKAAALQTAWSVRETGNLANWSGQ